MSIVYRWESVIAIPHLNFMRRKRLTILLTSCVSIVIAVAGEKTQLAPEIFAPGVISTDLDESGGSFSPDGRSFYFVRRSAYTTAPPIGIICFSVLKDGRWTRPEIAPFSGTFVDGPSCFSPDGKRLYFGSKRPTQSNPNGRDWNIWFVEKTESGWSEPKEVSINSPQNDANPTVAADGTLYFASDRDSQPGYMHIYRARLTDDHYGQLEKLGPEINGGDADLNPYISPDQKFLIFASYRKDALISGGNPYQRSDLYISEQREGYWSQARPLEHGINTAATEGNPTICDKWFYFSSERSPFQVPLKQQLTTARWQERRNGVENGVGNIYRIPVEALELKQ
jgi:hypothetical protein